MVLLELVSRHFVKIQIVIFMIGVAFCIQILKRGKNTSQFRNREADRTDLNRMTEGPTLADAMLSRKKSSEPPPPGPPPRALPGIRLRGEPHEILGIPDNASEAETLKAYKDLIKRFHPDRIQGQAKEQNQFYEDASIALNLAKEQMLKIIRARKG